MLESLGHQGSNKVAANASVSETAAVSKKSTTSDSISKSEAESSGKTVAADSPELQQASYIFWFSGNNEMQIQNYGGSEKTAIDSMTALNSTELFLLQQKNRMMEIGIGVLEAWGKSIKEEGEYLRRELKSEAHQASMERKELRGHEAYLQTLSQDQRLSLDEFNRYNPAVSHINEGFGRGMEDMLAKAKAGDPAFIAAAPFITGSAITSTPRTDVPAVAGTVAVGPLDVTPIKDGVSSVLGNVASSYSVDLATLGALYANGAMNLAAIHTFPVAAGAEAPKIDYEYARNYATQILKVVNDSEFNSFAMAIISHTTPEGQQLDKGQMTALTHMLKVSLLSTALAFLYSMESSFRGKGGGIRSQEFMALVRPVSAEEAITVPEDDSKSPLISQINAELNALDQFNPNHSAQLLASIQTWIDSSSSHLNLMKVSPLFNLMRADSAPVPRV